MFLGIGVVLSVTHAADSPARGDSADPKVLVVLVYTKDRTRASTDASRRISVPAMFVSTNSRALCVSTCGLWSVAQWMTAVTSRS